MFIRQTQRFFMENRFFYGLLTLPLTAALLYSFQNQGKAEIYGIALMKVLIYNKKYLLEIMYLPHNVYYVV